MKAYIASGWFNQQQTTDLQNIKECLMTCRVSFFSPKDECLCPPTADIATQMKTFNSNLAAIKACDFVVVNTRDKDLGTIFEAGYAYANSVPIIYYCEGLKGDFNLMLSRSSIAVARSKEELQEHILGICQDKNYYMAYKGLIE